MSNELATTFETMMAEAKTLVDSGFLPKAIRTPAQALAIMTMSKELGIGYWTGFNGINVISGKPTISPQLMLALIFKRHPEAVIQINGDAQSCTVFMQRRDGQSHTEVFTIDQASKIMTKEDDKVIPLTQKYNWRQQPAVMLKWRAVAACARVIFPDVIMGFYGPEEIDPDVTVDETGEMIQQHPAIEAEIVQDARETHQDAIPDTPQPQGGQQHAASGKRPYSASALRAAIQDSIMKRVAQTADNALPVSDDKARKLAIQWRNVVASEISGEKARYAITSYLLGVDITTYKGLAIATHDALHAWLTVDPKSARQEADNVWQELGTMEPAGPDVGDGDNMPYMSEDGGDPRNLSRRS